MKVAYFDCTFGAAGDMLLGALIAAGLPVDKWQSELKKIALPPGSFSVEIRDVVRCSIAAKKVDVHDLAHAQGHEHSHSHEHAQEHDADHAHEHSHEHAHEHSADRAHSHSHEHAHEHDANHTHEGSHEHTTTQSVHGAQDAHEHGDSRNLPEILRLIDDSQISSRAKELAKSIFQALGEAEAKVHAMPVESVHFHEVGAIDAIVDIVGFAIAYDLFGIETSVVSEVAVGSGRVKTMHGLFPVPAPAVVNLLTTAGIRIAQSPFKHECLTPTGAAILAVVCQQCGPMPSMKITSSGYGAGTYDPADHPNVCRVIIGESANKIESTNNGAAPEANFESEIVAVLEANIDDLSPQILSFAMERLFDAGALDVSVSPVVMKKSRSGHLLAVLCKPGDRVALQEVILNHTSSLGVRSYLCERLTVAREWREVTLGEGSIIRVKLGRDRNGKLINAQPEFEDCAAYARRHDVPLKDVIAQALALTHLDWGA